MLDLSITLQDAGKVQGRVPSVTAGEEQAVAPAGGARLQRWL